MDNCIFCKIVKKEIPKEFVYEDEEIVAFADIHPIKPVHLLVIPKQHVSELATVKNPELLEKLFVVVQKLIEKEKLVGKGYRVTINGGGAQVIDHLHIHLIGPITKTATLG